MSSLSYLQLILLFSHYILHGIHSKRLKCPLGVHPDECSKYNSDKDPYFYCGGNKDKKIPLKYVNDDYCDCVHTGDDEPGTSACNHGKFWCANAGYSGRFIYSSLINDGLCDCCDGSDETNNPRIQCPNVCDAKAKEQLQEFILQKKKYMEGIKVKNSLVQVAKSKLNAKRTRKQEINKELAQKRAELTIKEELKKVTEQKENDYKEQKRVKREAEEAQKEAERKAKCESEGGTNCDDPNSENDNTDSENTDENESESDENTEEDLRSEKEESPRERRRRERRERYEARAERNRERREKRNLEREGEAQQRLQEIRDKYEKDTDTLEVVGDESDNAEIEHIHTPDEEFPYPEQYRKHEENEDKSEEEEVVHTPDEEFPYPEQYRKHEENEGDSSEDEDDGFDWSEFDEEEEDMDIYEAPPVEEKDPIEDGLRDKARDARNAYNDLNRDITNLENDLKDIEQVLTMDFGEKNVYASLFDECYSSKIQKYDYEICPFKKAQQKEGHSSTDLGSFKSFGYNEKRELIMSFEDGQKCWNGPKRSASVRFKCDTEAEITDVLEPSTCTYEMTFHTPLACRQEELDKFTELINNQFKTEL